MVPANDGVLPVTTIRTQRLLLRPILTADAEFMFQLMNEPAFIRNVADRGIRTPQDAEKYITQKMHAHYAQHGFGFYLVELQETAAPVGVCGLMKRDTLEDVDVGFAFLERSWGNGYAFESAAAVMRYGRHELGLARIVALTAPDNLASIKLLEKLGLRFEKIIHLPGYGPDSKLFV